MKRTIEVWAAVGCVCVALGTNGGALAQESGTLATTRTTEKTAAVGTNGGAAERPDPGCDWILRKRSENDRENRANAAVGTVRTALADVAAVGKIVAVDSKEIETEDRRVDRRERTPKRPGDALLFLPPVDPSAAEAFCVEIRSAGGARDRDRFWLRNGDEFDGQLLKIDRRRVWIRAFGVEFAVPRGRVRAVRFAENNDDKIEKKDEE